MLPDAKVVNARSLKFRLVDRENYHVLRMLARSVRNDGFDFGQVMRGGNFEPSVGLSLLKNLGDEK